MEFIDVIAYLSIPAGFGMAFAIGANDVANAIGTSVGSGALTVRKAIILGGLFEFLGTIIMGRFVAGTLKTGIIDVAQYEDSMDQFALGMFCTLIAATLWLLLATFLSLPVSTTHTVVGGIMGFSLAEKGFKSIKWLQFGKIVMSWFTSPLLGCLLSFLLYFSVFRRVTSKPEPWTRAVRYIPIYASLTISVLLVFILEAELPLAGVHLPWWLLIILFFATFILVAIVMKFLVIPYVLPRLYQAGFGVVQVGQRTGRSSEELVVMPAMDSDDSTKVSDEEEYTTPKNGQDAAGGKPGEDDFSGCSCREEKVVVFDDTPTKENEDLEKAEETFKFLILLSAVFVAFAHGSNDVANAVGPVAALWEFHQTGTIDPNAQAPVPFWLLLMGGVGIVAGLAVLGHKVIKTVGEKITKLTHTRGYSAQLATATTVLLASSFSLPISTTHTLVGSVTGTGLVPGSQPGGASVNGRMLLRIFGGWVVTLLAGGVGTILLYIFFRLFL